MIDRDELDACVLDILKNANPGRGTRPKGISAYQIVDRLPDHIAEPLIKKGGIGGRGGGVRGQLSAAQECQHAAMRLANKGLVKYDYFDAKGLAFHVRKQWVDAGYAVSTLYRYTGPLEPRLKGWHIVSIDGDRVILLHSDPLNEAITAPPGSHHKPLASSHMVKERREVQDLLAQGVEVHLSNVKITKVDQLPEAYNIESEN